jgi:hypothetical protein
MLNSQRILTTDDTDKTERPWFKITTSPPQA